MENQSAILKKGCRPPRKSSLWKCKNVSDISALKQHLNHQLASNILGIYAKSLFVDLKIEASHGVIYTHQFIVAARDPCSWYLLSKLGKLQRSKSNTNIEPGESLTISLPCILHSELAVFIRSLYTSHIYERYALSFKSLLEEQIRNIQGKIANGNKLLIQKLDLEEELQVQEIILEQLKSGQIRTLNGHLSDIGELILPDKCDPTLPTIGETVSSDLNDNNSAIFSPRSFFIPLEEPSTIKSLKKTKPAFLKNLSVNKKENLISDEFKSVQERGINSNPVINFRNNDNSSKREENRESSLCKISPKQLFASKNTNINRNDPHLVLNNIDLNCKGGYFEQVERKNLCRKSSKYVFNINANSEWPREFSKKEVCPKSISKISSFVDNYGQNVDLSIDKDIDIEIMERCEGEKNFPSVANSEFACNDEGYSKSTGIDNINDSNVNPLRPLVRTRTFEVIDPMCDSIHIDDESESSPIEMGDGDGLSTFSDDAKNRTFTYSEGKNLNLNKHSTCHNVETTSKVNKEMERMKGTLLFESNFQTFSNIPQGNISEPMMEVRTLEAESAKLLSLVDSYSNDTKNSNIFAGKDNVSFEKMSDFIKNINSDVCSDSVLKKCTIPINTENKSQFNNLTEDDMSIDVGGSSTRSHSPDSLCVISPRKVDGNLRFIPKEDVNFEEKEREYADKDLPNDPNLPTDLKVKLVENVDDKFECDSSINKNQFPSQVGSSVPKDVDSIPLVCGYVDESENGKYEAKENSKQSIFSMFIDLDEISPENKEKEEIGKPNKIASSGGFSMFIEVDAPSPKLKKRIRSDSKDLKFQKKKESLDKVKDTLFNSDAGQIKKQESTMGKNTVKEEKKGLFIFRESESTPKKHQQRPIISKKNKPEKESSKQGVMSKSAPSNSILFGTENMSNKISTLDGASKLDMTKSVIDRDEFISQPAARRNVSLNDKINESSRIPRPIANFKEIVRSEIANKSSSGTPEMNLREHLIVSQSTQKSKCKPGNKSNEQSSSEHGAASLTVSFSDALTCSSLPFENDELSEVSDVSSLLSSLERSTGKSDPGCNSKNANLGDDLLKMFMNEVNTDVTIQIGEKTIRAHKCILASRCVYFAAMLSGSWVESKGNVIKMQGFSYESVLAAIKHIYSGSVSLPNDVSVDELAALSDMLALDGLRDVVSLHLKANKCHYFHKPCSECLSGILETVPMAKTFCLDEVYIRCLQWISSHFVVVFPTKEFASLPPEIQDVIVSRIIDELSVANCLTTALGCDRILSVLSPVKWAQPVFHLTAGIAASAYTFIGENFSKVLKSEKFIAMGVDGGWNVETLEAALRESFESVSSAQAILSHIQISNLIDSKYDDSMKEFSEPFLSLLSRLLNMVEKYLIHNANRVSVCRQWPLLSSDVQKRIKDAALIVVEFTNKSLAPRPKLSSANKSLNPRNHFSESFRCSNDVTSTMRARTSSLSEYRVGHSSSSSSVIQNQKTPVSRFQTSFGRSTPPPTSKVLPTPPPTRASTLRAQAVQVQRSQSQSAVKDQRSRNSNQSLHLEASTDDESTQGSRLSFPRGATFTRSLSRPQSTSARPKSSPGPSTSTRSRPTTPGMMGKSSHRRNASGSNLADRCLNSDAHESRTKNFSTFNGLSSAKDKPLSKFKGRPPEGFSKVSLDSATGSSTFTRKSSRDKTAKLDNQVVESYKTPLNVFSKNDIGSDFSDDSFNDSGDTYPIQGLGNRSNTFCKDDKDSK